MYLFLDTGTDILFLDKIKYSNQMNYAILYRAVSFLLGKKDQFIFYQSSMPLDSCFFS
jgi:hypothetical protein